MSAPRRALRGAAVVERLLDELEQLAEPVVLVIDDLHELDSSDARSWLECLLTPTAAQVRVVLATREDPALGLHRLRLAGDLTELRGWTFASRSTSRGRSPRERDDPVGGRHHLAA